MRQIIFLVSVLLSGVASASYNGYKVYKVFAKTEAENAYLKSLDSHPDFDLWSSVNKVGNPVSVLVAPDVQNQFESNLKTIKVDYSIEIEDVERVVQAEKEYHSFKTLSRSGRITFDQYLRYDEINSYLTQLAQDYADLVTIESIGQSYEKRELNIIKISKNPNDPARPAVFVDAGIHAREWIAPAVALYLINQLVENPANSNLIETVDWIILPSVNPDGYEYTWTDDRFWRKTRSPSTECYGCDANRNFGYHWMEAGASDYECSEVFAGSEAFSEVETQHMRDYLLANPNVKGYLSLHSYGQYVLYPWSYADVLPENADELQALGEDIAAAIGNVNGTIYTVGATTETLYAAAGASQDWAMGGAGIPIVYSMELPGGGILGFDLPPSEIQRVVEETFEGLKVFGQYFSNMKL